MNGSTVAIGISLVAATFSCYFAACSVALRTFSRTRLAEMLEARGKLDRYEWFIERWPRLLLTSSTLRMSLNLVSLLAIVYAVEQLLPQFHLLLRYLLAFGVVALFASVFTVAIPSSWGRYHPERLIARSMVVLRVSDALFTPLIRLLSLLDPVVRRISGRDEEEDSDSPLTDDILSVVEEHEAEHEVRVDEDQKEMLEAVLELNNTTAGQIMTPRTDITGIEVHATLEEVKQIIDREGHSRIPVYEENLDKLVGILYVKDLIRFLGDGKAFSLSEVLRDPFMVPESKQVSKLLAEFKAQKVHLAIVLDEYGGTAGLVTIEDILEEIVGDIEDEYEPDEEKPTITTLQDGAAEIDARVRIDDLNDELDLQLPEDEDFETVGGFVVSSLGRIPEVGDSFEFEGVRLTVTDAERTKVRRIFLEQLEQEPVSSNGSDSGNGDH